MSLYDSLSFWKIEGICKENVAGEQGFALQQLFPLYKSSHSLMMGASKLAILIFSIYLFHL